MELRPDRHGIVRRSTFLDRGRTDDDLSGLVRSGQLEHLSHGAYVIPSVLPDGPRRSDVKYRLRCTAFATSGRGEAPVLSHQSAAALHRLPLLNPDLTDIHLLSGGTGGGHRNRRHIHPGTVDEAGVVTIDGVRVTGLVRTAVDIACAGSFAQALTVFDGALRLGATVAMIKAELKARRRVGKAMADRALRYADSESESVGESWSRAQFIEAGLPVPRLQVWCDLDGDVARVDFDWGGKLVGEFDGLKKYGRELRRPGETADDVVIREKKREDALRARGVMVIRWTWADLRAGTVPELVRTWLARLGIAG